SSISVRLRPPSSTLFPYTTLFRSQDDDVHLLQVVERDQVLEVVDLARHHEEGHHHREAGEDGAGHEVGREDGGMPAGHDGHREVDRKSTRLNSSHVKISYAVFCLK